jgi:tetratricopeptide (TPR) repeat protein
MDKAKTRLEQALYEFVHGDKETAWKAFVEALTVEGFDKLTPDALVGVPTANEPQRSLLTCRLMVELIPDSWESHCFLAHAYRRNGQYVEALRAYDRAIECAAPHMSNAFILGDVVSYRIYKAQVLIEMNQPGEAFVELLLARQLNSERPSVTLAEQLETAFKDNVTRLFPTW